MGVKVTGLQLADLDSAGLDQLGLLAAQRGFVVFTSNSEMKQSYTLAGMERQLEIARYAGGVSSRLMRQALWGSASTPHSAASANN